VQLCVVFLIVDNYLYNGVERDFHVLHVCQGDPPPVAVLFLVEVGFVGAHDFCGRPCNEDGVDFLVVLSTPEIRQDVDNICAS